MTCLSLPPKWLNPALQMRGIIPTDRLHTQVEHPLCHFVFPFAPLQTFDIQEAYEAELCEHIKTLSSLTASKRLNMDPFSAFSLACGIIQVVDFSTRVLGMCKDMYKNGSLTQNQDLEERAKHLLDLQGRLKPADYHRASTSVQTSDTRLQQVARECSATADQLVQRLRGLKIEGPHRKRDVSKKIFKAFWERRDIRDIEKRLNAYKQALDREILINLRSVSRSYR